MGEKKEAWAERISVLTPYRVTSELMEKAGSGAHFLHCLPAFHDFNTTVAQDIHNQLGVEPFEVSDDVFLSERSVVFQQAENRMHTIKAVMVATAGQRPTQV